MNKTDLLDKFARDGESRLLLARVLDQQQRARQRGIPTHTGFLSPAQQAQSADLLMAAAPGEGLLHGGYPDAERKLWAFLPDWLEEEAWLAGEDCPLCAIAVTLPQGARLTHRDYLGAILNLGIDRSKIGDILLDQEAGYVFCQESMADFLAEELTRIRHTSVQARRFLEKEPLPTPRREEVSGTVASPRLDSVIALAFGSSRNSILGLIEGGKVFVNGKSIVSNAYSIKEGDIVSVRGKGKFQFGSVTNKTKKNRFHIVLYRYC